MQYLFRWNDRKPWVCFNKDTREHFCGKPSSIFWKGIQICFCTAVDCMDVTIKNYFILHPFFMLAKTFQPFFLRVIWFILMFQTDSLLLFPNHLFFFLGIFRICWVIISAVSSGSSVILNNVFYRVLKVFCSERTMTCKRFFGPWQAQL